jgi:hypothetical protein
MSLTEDELTGRLSHDLKGYYGIVACAIYCMKHEDDSPQGSESWEDILGRNLKAIDLIFDSLLAHPADSRVFDAVKRDVTAITRLLASIQSTPGEPLQPPIRQWVDQTLNLAKALTHQFDPATGRACEP